MSAFSVFQASFDGRLRPQHRRKGRLAAIALTSAAVALIGGSLLTILHLNSNQLSDMANAGSPRDIRVAATETTQSKSCAQQTWPFIEGRCLIDTKSLRRAERVIPRQSMVRQRLASEDTALVSRKKRARAKPFDGRTIVAARPRPTQTLAGTTGAAPRNEAASATVKATNVANATPPISTPTTATPAANSTPPKIDNAIALRRSQELRREARRKERLTREQREARAELRARRGEQRSASRWNDGAYSSSYSGGWQRGPFDGGFFSTIR